jgi:hypothetical protein
MKILQQNFDKNKTYHLYTVLKQKNDIWMPLFNRKQGEIGEYALPIKILNVLTTEHL